MYFWNYKQLARDLKNNKVSDKQYKIYIVLFVLGLLLNLVSLIQMPVEFLIFLALWLGVTYLTNKKGDGKDYFKRLVCLDFPTTIRSIAVVVVITIFALLAAHDKTAPPGSEKITPLIAFACGLVAQIYGLLIIFHGFRIASAKD